jgi:hypothetical protein
MQLLESRKLLALTFLRRRTLFHSKTFFARMKFAQVFLPLKLFRVRRLKKNSVSKCPRFLVKSND